MKNDIILCSLNSKYVHSTLAVWYLFSSIKEKLENVKCDVYESTINCDLDEISKDLLGFDSKIYAFSCYIWNIDKVLYISEKIKEAKPESIILLGGPEVSYNSGDILENHSFVDYIICGEGEEAIVKFLKNYENRDFFSKTDGISFRGMIAEPFVSDKEPVSPYCSEYFEGLNGRIAYIETTRGCPYSCAFCLSGRCGGVRYFELGNVFNDIIKLANSGTKTIKFIDRTFNANANRANEILKFILEKHGNEIPSDVCFHFEIAGDIIKESTLMLLEKAPLGLFQLEIGLQTFNEKTLESINRKTNIDKLISNINKLNSFGNMHIHIDLIAGLPYEGISSFEKTFNMAYSLKADMLQLGFLKMLHGSPMRDNPDEYPCGFSEAPPYEVMFTPWISREELNKIHCCEDALERLYNSGRFLEILNFLFDEKGLNPFKFFCEFGLFMDKFKNISLDEYSKLFFEFITDNFNFDRNLIRDKFVCDRMASNASGKLPAFLKEERKEYGKIKKYLKAEGLVESFALLSTENTVVFQDRINSRQKNGRYNLIFKNITDFISEE